MKASREIREWVLASAGVAAHDRLRLVAEIRDAAANRYPGLEVVLSYATGENGGTGKPWLVEGGNDPEWNRKVAIHLRAVERHLTARCSGRQYGRADVHPEDPEAKICGKCRSGVLRERRLVVGVGAKKSIEDCPVTELCDNCGAGW